MRNLLEETLEELQSYGKNEKDVKFVTTGAKFFTWTDFANLAKEINYDDGLGAAEINRGLMIVGDNWWLERAEYDGSEWWEFKTIPIQNAKFNVIDKSDLLED